MPLVEPHNFRLDHGVIITCAQPIDSEKLAEILNGFLQEITEGKDDPESEDTHSRKPEGALTGLAASALGFLPASEGGGGTALKRTPARPRKVPRATRFRSSGPAGKINRDFQLSPACSVFLTFVIRHSTR
jgi:hypothetical protein